MSADPPDDENRTAPPDAEEPLTALGQGFRGRTLKTVWLASKLGKEMLRRSLPFDRAAAEIDEDEAVKSATALLEQLDGLKGLMMKFGQMASYISPTLPPKARRILARLQSEGRPMAFERIARVIEDELGGPPASLFDTFEEIPFAAASLGQVHRATLGGRTLAVKVQYPDIERLIAADLKLVGRLGRFVMALSPVDGGSLVDELRERVKEECDYVAEAQNQRLFRGLLEDLGGQVPQVVEERSSRRVLTSTHSAGLPFQAFCDAASQPIKDRAGTNIFAAAFTCIFQHCVYNADPHPGNYLFTEQGQVVFLDFGCIKRFDAGFIDRWKRLALTVLDDDRPGFKDALDATGLVARPRRFDYDYHWQLMQYLYEPFLTAPFTFTHEYVRRSYDLMIFRNPNRFSTGMTRDWLFVNRLQWGLNSVLATLEATGPWNDLFRGVVESPTHSVV